MSGGLSLAPILGVWGTPWRFFKGKLNGSPNGSKSIKSPFKNRSTIWLRFVLVSGALLVDLGGVFDAVDLQK